MARTIRQQGKKMSDDVREQGLSFAKFLSGRSVAGALLVQGWTGPVPSEGSSARTSRRLRD
jgi:hypothetical protein